MRLSNAAVLGAQRWKLVCFPVEDKDQAEKEGCFLQLALMAVGFSAEEVTDGKWAQLTAQTWPWTKAPTPLFGGSRASRIWGMNDMGVPFEEILAYVRANEPPEPAAPAMTEADKQLERIVENDRDWSANTRG